MATGKIQQDVVIKVTGQKDLAEAEQLIDSIDGKTAKASVEIDSTGVAAGVSDVQEALDEIDGTKAEAQVDANVREALDALDEMAEQAKKSQIAVEALSTALGPELTARMDVERAVSDFQRMNLTLDQITANADVLGGKLREIDSLDVGGNLTTNLDRARGATDNLGRSVGSSRSALANMVGNATQDLGNLGGVAGSAGVAIGQMGEYMADAALEGEGLGSILTSFGKVAGPIALVSVGIGLITSAIGRAQAEQKKIAEETQDIAEGVAETFRQLDISSIGSANDLLAQMALNFIEADENGGQILLTMKELGLEGENLGKTLVAMSTEVGQADLFSKYLQGAPEFTGLTKSAADAIGAAIATGTDYEGVLNQVAVAMGLGTVAADANIDATLDWIRNNQEIIEQLLTIEEGGEAFDLSDFVDKTTEALLRSQGGLEAWIQAKKEVDVTGLAPDEAELAILQRAFEIINNVANATEEWAKQNRLVEAMPEEWAAVEKIADKYRRTLVLTAEEQQFLTRMAEIYGTTETDILNRGIGMWQEHQNAQKAAIDQMIADLQEWAQRMQETAIAVGEFGMEMADLAGIEQVAERAGTAIEDAFDLANAPIDALEEVVEFEEGLRDFATFLRDDLKGVIPDIFDPNDLNREEFLNQFRGLRTDVQREIQQAFVEAGGGAAGAQAGTEAANAYVQQIFDTLGGALTKDQIIQLLGIGDLTATLKVAIDAESLATASAVLAAFVKIPGIDPLLAFQLQVGLAAGTITPEAMMVIVNDQLKLMGAAELPAVLLPPDARSMNTARDQANAFYKIPGNEAFMKSLLGEPTNVREILGDTQTDLNGTYVTIPSRVAPPTLPWWQQPRDMGGTVTGYGGIVAERRPEIINGRWLVTEPSYAPPGTRVTSGSRTARILRAGRVRGLKRYDSGGMIAGPQTVNFNFNGVGAIGNRFDLMRTVQRANLDKLRLLGERG